MADHAVLQSRTDSLFARSGGLFPPKHVIASWPAANHVNPEERGWGGPAALIVVMVMAIAVYFARIWARLVVAKNAGIDDLLMSVAMLPLIGLTVSSILGIRVYGFQWHAWDQTNASRITTREITLAIELHYLISSSFVKISILCFYRRITGSLTNAFVRWVWASIIICILYGVLFTLALVFLCTPPAGFIHLFDKVWRAQHKMHCRNEGALIIACAVVGTIQDFVICLLPMFLVWKLKMPTRQKLALCGIFGLGLITCVCGILRTYYSVVVYHYTYDISWYAYYGWTWTCLEIDLGVICGSAPALKVFFRRYFSGSTSADYYAGAGSNRTPFQLSQSRTRAALFRAAHSAGASRVEPDTAEASDISLKGIKVSQGLDIHVEERDDMSQKSFASTSNLTSQPATKESTWKSPHDWKRPVQYSLSPVSRKTLENESLERDVASDVERGI
ncbi:hypothetical protein BKA66DRAFT_477831 [Pyrenochaeta sp. MPI-SDFR-AT-0127]|nr:hypothetical protein BKA66DRAFT_477831 [Pyrenochaeta sp. MPI-SDFR-AT-0127]